MPQLPRYEYTGLVDCTIPPNREILKEKSVIVTGGANGMGEATARAFAAERDAVHGLNAQFVKCDITSWEDQVSMFEATIAHSPYKSCDIIIANVGISRAPGDDLWPLDDPDAAPVKPKLNIVNVNFIGTMYTWKLAVHYFRKQPDTEDQDRCFVMKGSMTAWIDSPANWQYASTKYALRRLMRTARRNSHEQGIRINYFDPCYIKSAIRSAEYEAQLISKGVEFAPQDAVATCMIKLAADRKINGYSLMITPRSVAKEGFIDVGKDDHIEEGYFKHTQEVQLRIIEDQWVPGWSKGRTPEGAQKS